MTAAERYLNLSARDLRLELDELYAQYVGCLDEERFEDWPEFFTDDCLYRIVPRDNFERGLPIATWHSEGRAGLLDRIVAIRKTMNYAPRYIRRMVSAIRPMGWRGPSSTRAPTFSPSRPFSTSRVECSCVASIATGLSLRTASSSSGKNTACSIRC
jgi:hypothetical protein